MRRLKTVRRPPIYPKTPGHLPCSSLTHPLPLPSPRPSVSFGGFGVRRPIPSRYRCSRDCPCRVGSVPLSLLSSSSLALDPPPEPEPSPFFFLLLLLLPVSPRGWFDPLPLPLPLPDPELPLLPLRIRLASEPACRSIERTTSTQRVPSGTLPERDEKQAGHPAPLSELSLGPMVTREISPKPPFRKMAVRVAPSFWPS